MLLSMMEPVEARRLLASVALDVTFGNDGRLTPAGQGAGYVGVTSAGIIAATQVRHGNSAPSDVLQRYKFDGTFDPTYTATDLGNSLGQFKRFAIDAQGRTVYVHIAKAGTLTISRFKANGGIDSSFGTNGTTTLKINFPSNETIEDTLLTGIATASDGSVYIDTTLQTFLTDGSGTSGIFRDYVFKLTPAGAIDTNFAAGGRLRLSGQLATNFIAVGAQDRLLISQVIATGTLAITQYTAAGVVDTTYGTNGTATVHAGAAGNSTSVSLQLDAQKRLLITSIETPIEVRRLTTTGQVDTDFGNGGFTTITGQGTFNNARAVVPQADGKILVELSNSDGQAYFVRLNANGTSDTTFGGTGLENYAFTDDIADAVAILPDGNILGAVGYPDATEPSLSIEKLSPLASVSLGSSGTLFVVGGSTASTVTISLVSGTIHTVFNGQTFDFAAADVGGINALIRSGNNNFSSTVDLPTTVNAGNGNDTIATGNADDSVNSGAGDDQIATHGGFDTVDIGGGNNMLDAGAEGGIINASRGAGEETTAYTNTITGTSGSWTLNVAGAGKVNIALAGEQAIVHADGTTQSDNIDLSAITGPTTVYGGRGDDSILGGSGNDFIIPGLGNDTVRAGAGNDFVGGDLENNADNLPNVTKNDLYDMGAGNDTVADGYGDNTILGGDGNDSLRTGGGNDSISGGIGRDIIRGGAGNDTLNGDGSRDTIFGQDGDDSISGGNNGDTIIGGIGNDTLIGNQGDDLIVAGNPNAARVQSAFNHIDGGSGTDRLQLEADDDLVVSVETLIITVS